MREITTKGERKAEQKEEKGDYYRCEISQGAYSRTVARPAEVDDAKVKATMKDGMLELTLPKRENRSATPSRSPDRRYTRHFSGSQHDAWS